MATIRYEPVLAQIETIFLPVSVTAAAGSAGVAIASTAASSKVRVENQSRTTPVEYKVGAGAWNSIDPRDSGDADLAVDLSKSQLFLRKGSAAADAPVDVFIDEPKGIYVQGTSAEWELGEGAAGKLFTTRPLTAADDGKVFEVAANATATVPADLGETFACMFDVVGGTLSIARSGAATLNGAATTLTRTAQMVALRKRLTGAPNDHSVTGF